MEKQGITFISGGVRSGKSSFGESLAADLANASNSKLHYIAPCQVSDSEMRERIAKHVKGREESGLNWITWEQPRELAKLSPNFTPEDVVLLDCLTTLLNNEFFLGEWQDSKFRDQVAFSILEGVKLIDESCRAFIVVSNEVFHETVADNELVHSYVSTLGKIHQEVVSLANQAFLVEAGVPFLMKGARE
jgi:adenosylcobinamide kinase / adenosylcobinamide-phosphate guanylyltransferase